MTTNESTLKIMSPEELLSLHEDIWQRHESTGYRKEHYYTEKRLVTPEEWDRLVITAPHYIIVPENACFGFNFGITFYDSVDVYLRNEMGVDPDDFRKTLDNFHVKPPPPEPLLAITGSHFDLRFNEAWEKMSPLSHNDQNAALLKKYRIGSLHSKDYYDY